MLSGSSSRENISDMDVGQLPKDNDNNAKSTKESQRNQKIQKNYQDFWS